jgi:REP element-mobilizing transposase RayT
LTCGHVGWVERHTRSKFPMWKNPSETQQSACNPFVLEDRWVSLGSSQLACLLMNVLNPRHNGRHLIPGVWAMQYRRSRMEGGTYFFTVVTYRRQKILSSPENIESLRDSFRKVIEAHPFTIDGFVALPDHLHCIWTLPKSYSDFAMRWRLIKSTFSRKCNWGFPQESEISRMKKGERTIWQRR